MAPRRARKIHGERISSSSSSNGNDRDPGASASRPSRAPTRGKRSRLDSDDDSDSDPAFQVGARPKRTKRRSGALKHFPGHHNRIKITKRIENSDPKNVAVADPETINKAVAEDNAEARKRVAVSNTNLKPATKRVQGLGKAPSSGFREGTGTDSDEEGRSAHKKEKKMTKNDGEAFLDVVEGFRPGTVKMNKYCMPLLNDLKTMPYYWVFNQPVDPKDWDNIDEYFDIIDFPMDLGTVERRLASGEYPSYGSFADGVRQTFQNAIKFNPSDTEFHIAAKTYLREFEKSWNNLMLEIASKLWIRGRDYLEEDLPPTETQAAEEEKEEECDRSDDVEENETGVDESLTDEERTRAELGELVEMVEKLFEDGGCDNSEILEIVSRNPECIEEETVDDRTRSFDVFAPGLPVSSLKEIIAIGEKMHHTPQEKDKTNYDVSCSTPSNVQDVKNIEKHGIEEPNEI